MTPAQLFTRLRGPHLAPAWTQGTRRGAWICWWVLGRKEEAARAAWVPTAPSTGGSCGSRCRHTTACVIQYEERRPKHMLAFLRCFLSLFFFNMLSFSVLKKKGKQKGRKFQFLIQVYVCVPMNMHERSLGKSIQNCQRLLWVTDLHFLF